MNALALALSVTVFLTACDANPGSPIGAAAKLAVGIESDYIIHVKGTEGAKFSGSYMIMRPDGSSTQKSVEGVIPTEFKMRGSLISASFQKQGKNGTLIVEIARGGRIVNQSDTNAAYGVVSVATQ